jgi:hypothetical protein
MIKQLSLLAKDRILENNSLLVLHSRIRSFIINSNNRLENGRKVRKYEISSSHAGEYEAQNLLGCTAV